MCILFCLFAFTQQSQLNIVGIWCTDTWLFLLLSGMLLCGCATICLSINLDIWLDSSFEFCKTNKQTNLYEHSGRTSMGIISRADACNASQVDLQEECLVHRGTRFSSIRNCYTFFSRLLDHLPFTPAVFQHPSCLVFPPPLPRTGVLVRVLMGQQISLITVSRNKISYCTCL